MGNATNYPSPPGPNLIKLLVGQMHLGEIAVELIYSAANVERELAGWLAGCASIRTLPVRRTPSFYKGEEHCREF